MKWTASLDHLTLARIVLTPTVYLLHPLIMLGIMDMAELVRKRRFWCLLPILVSAPLLYTSQWTHLIYWFSPDSQYVAANTFLRYFPVYLFLLYIGLFLGAFILHYARHGTTERKGILVSICIAMIGLLFHIFLRIDIDYSTLFASLLLVHYLSLYVLTAEEDTLTQLLNRQCYYADSVRLKDRISAVVSSGG